MAAWKTCLRCVIDEHFGCIAHRVSNMWAACAVDPRFADMAHFGVAADVRDGVWDFVSFRHIALKTARIRVASGDDTRQMSRGQLDVAKAQLMMLRDEMTAISEAFLKKLAAGQTTIDAVEPLAFWRAYAEKGRHDENFAHFTSVASTACALLCAPVIDATAICERRSRRAASLMGDGMLEQEVVCAHLIDSPLYDFDRVCETVCAIQRELQ